MKNRTAGSGNRFAIGMVCALALLLLPSLFGAEAEEIPGPVFSLPAGFYDGAIFLEMKAPEGYEIWYTQDCTDPATSSTAKRYTDALELKNNNRDFNRASSVGNISLNWYDLPKERVEKGNVIRAVCRDQAGNAGPETCNTYFVNKKASYYREMKVISLVTDHSNLFDWDTGIYMVGSEYFRWRNSEDYEEYEHIADPRYPTNYNRHGMEWERPCFIQVFENGEHVFEQNVGMRISGRFSRCEFQKSITLYARKEYSPETGKMKYDFFDGRCLDENGKAITSYDRVTLRNGGNDVNSARFRDDLNQALFAPMKVGTQTKTDAILFINGEFWGYYSLQERVGRDYIASHYDQDKENVTVIKTGVLEDGSEEVYNEWLAYYAQAIEQDFSDDSVYLAFCERVDIESLCDYFIAQSYVNNWDFAIGINNWMMWRTTEPNGSTYGDGKWRFIFFDTEFSAGLYGSETTSAWYDYLANMSRECGNGELPMLIYKLQENKAFLDLFYDRYVYAIEHYFNLERVLPMIDERQSAISQAFADTQKRFGLWNNMENEVERIRAFFRARGDFALYQLKKFCNRAEDQLKKTMFRGIKGWKLWKDEKTQATMTTPQGTSNLLSIQTENTAPENWHVQAYREISLKKGYHYSFTFNALGSDVLPFAVCVQKNEGNWDTYYYVDLLVSHEVSSVACEFTMDTDCPNAKVSFLCGTGVGEYRFFSLKMTEEKLNDD